MKEELLVAYFICTQKRDALNDISSNFLMLLIILPVAFGFVHILGLQDYIPQSIKAYWFIFLAIIFLIFKLVGIVANKYEKFVLDNSDDVFNNFDITQRTIALGKAYEENRYFFDKIHMSMFWGGILAGSLIFSDIIFKIIS